MIIFNSLVFSLNFMRFHFLEYPGTLINEIFDLSIFFYFYYVEYFYEKKMENYCIIEHPYDWNDRSYSIIELLSIIHLLYLETNLF